MRFAALALTAAALFTATACGSSTSDSNDKPAAADTPSSGYTAPTMDMDMSTPGASAADTETSTLDDAATYAAAMEQVFFSDGYPKDLAGALKAAGKLTNLKLSPGNTIASYVYDSGDQEFQLCVENASGAYSTYDTRPMSTIRSGKSGGCP